MAMYMAQLISDMVKPFLELDCPVSEALGLSPVRCIAITHFAILRIPVIFQPLCLSLHRGN